ncbi:MAG: antibiotic biosynthesis monooxygenase [Methanobrevibacter sp.]|jgi:quinol monooxygenase YgiN|nr:antibiotic biosynthesis monooxygenase [Methanobrevibacter sp.]
MIILLVGMIVKENKRDDFLKVTESLIKNTRLEKGNIDYNLYLDTESDNKYLMVENWKNDECLCEHNQSTHFKNFVNESTNLLSEEIEIKKYEV